MHSRYSGNLHVFFTWKGVPSIHPPFTHLQTSPSQFHVQYLNKSLCVSSSTADLELAEDKYEKCKKELDDTLAELGDI